MDPRDRDLCESDALLTDSHLDDLWEWYSGANKSGVDPQILFTKIVNSVRKPYRNQLLSNDIRRGSFATKRWQWTPTATAHSELDFTENIPIQESGQVLEGHDPVMKRLEELVELGKNTMLREELERKDAVMKRPKELVELGKNGMHRKELERRDVTIELLEKGLKEKDKNLLQCATPNKRLREEALQFQKQSNLLHSEVTRLQVSSLDKIQVVLKSRPAPARDEYIYISPHTQMIDVGPTVTITGNQHLFQLIRHPDGAFSFKTSNGWYVTWNPHAICTRKCEVTEKFHFVPSQQGGTGMVFNTIKPLVHRKPEDLFRENLFSSKNFELVVIDALPV